MAGLWETWRGDTGEPLESCTIITTEANSFMARIHDRMPVILAPRHYETWLDHERWNPDAFQSLLEPYPADQMFAHPVSTHVNSPANDDARCIEPKVQDQ